MILIEIPMKFGVKGPKFDNDLSIGSGNGLVPIWRRAIIWTHDGQNGNAI